MTLTYGHFTLPRFAGTRCVVLWGHNPHESDPPAVDGYKHARGDGARLLVIDPRRTRVASEADLHVALRPGTDCALALGMLHVIINQELYDRDFVRDWTVGFPELREHVQKYPPDRMARMCGVPSDTIVEAARIFAANRPTAVLLVAAAEHHANGVQTVRAIASLIAICGSFDVAGGSTYVDRLPLREPELPAGSFSAWRLGHEEYPIYTGIVDECQPMVLLDEEQPCRIDAFVMQGVNPVATWPDARRVREVLRALDLTVVMDLFMTESAEVADLILPAATFLERAELIDYGYFQAAPYLDVTQQVVEPPGECWPDWKLWLALAHRLGLDGQVPWRTLDEVIDFQLAGTQYTLARLRENGKGFFYRPRAERRYLTEGFATPSGKVELYSRRLAEVGQPPLPSLSREEEEQGTTAPDYPFLFTTGGREMGYTHSQFHDVPKMRAISPGPFCEINVEDAARLAIKDGARVEIESAAGKVRARARVTDGILMGVVHLPHGWPGSANANLLTDHRRRDPVSGLPSFKSGRCAIRPLTPDP
jgi:anaerobic selenocysteine-containing dehydrogenase